MKAKRTCVVKRLVVYTVTGHRPYRSSEETRILGVYTNKSTAEAHAKGIRSKAEDGFISVTKHSIKDYRGVYINGKAL